MEFAITLPQGGRAASPDAIREAAVQAEELGYSQIWVNDHITAPTAQTKGPSSHMFDPLMTLSTAAALTSSIGLASHLNVAWYQPIWLANALASLDVLSGGRLMIAVGVGWSEPEYEALGSDFHDRGVRTDEVVEILRTVWENDDVAIDLPHYRVPPVRLRPKPAHRIPVWVAGHSEPGYARAARLGDGFQGEAGSEITVGNIAERVARMRKDKPEESFPFSVYTWQWDPGERPADEIRRERDLYEEAGVQHVTIALRSLDKAARLRAGEELADLLGIEPR